MLPTFDIERYPPFPDLLLRIDPNHEIHECYTNVAKLAQEHVGRITNVTLPVSEIPIPQPGEIPPFPEEWFDNPEILLAMNFAAVIHAKQVRRSGEPTFIQHIFPVAMIAYTEAMHSLGPEAARKAAIIGFLHDTIEDSRENGLTYTGVELLIWQIFGRETYQQVRSLTVLSPKFLKREEEDRYVTHEWLKKIEEMNLLPRIVKLADLYTNNDGDTRSQRTTKLTQRAFLIELLRDAAPELANQCNNSPEI